MEKSFSGKIPSSHLRRLTVCTLHGPITALRFHCLAQQRPYLHQISFRPYLPPYIPLKLCDTGLACRPPRKLNISVFSFATNRLFIRIKLPLFVISTHSNAVSSVCWHRFNRTSRSFLQSQKESNWPLSPSLACIANGGE